MGCVLDEHHLVASVVDTVGPECETLRSSWPYYEVNYVGRRTGRIMRNCCDLHPYRDESPDPSQ